MPVRVHWIPRCLALVLLLCLALLVARAETQSLWQEEEQRFRVGLKIFPACLGALEALDERRLASGDLRVLVVHQGSDGVAQQAASQLRGLGQVRGLTLSVEVMAASRLDTERGDTISGIFVASVGLPSSQLRNWSERSRTLVFSPFAGDVEKGAVAGLYVSDRLLPFVNAGQARRAQLRFKPFFLKVARQHE